MVDDAGRRRVEALRQTITEGAQALHRSVERVSVQDVQRRMAELELHVLARGIELLGKASWVLNHRRLTGEYGKPMFGHRVGDLLTALDAQAEVLGAPRTLDEPVVELIAGVAEQFAMGGRYSHVDGLTTGEASSTYLLWNEVQNSSCHVSGPFAARARGVAELDLKGMEKPEREASQIRRLAYLRIVHTIALQRLERTFAVHLRDGQQAAWGTVPACREWVTAVAERTDGALDRPIPLEVRDWSCDCATLGQGFAIWVEVEKQKPT